MTDAIPERTMMHDGRKHDLLSELRRLSACGRENEKKLGNVWRLPLHLSLVGDYNILLRSLGDSLSVLQELSTAGQLSFSCVPSYVRMARSRTLFCPNFVLVVHAQRCFCSLWSKPVGSPTVASLFFKFTAIIKTLPSSSVDVSSVLYELNDYG